MKLPYCNLRTLLKWFLLGKPGFYYLSIADTRVSSVCDRESGQPLGVLHLDMPLTPAKLWHPMQAAQHGKCRHAG